MPDPEEEKESPVKSTAIVKYSAVNIPVTYSRLQCNTDLKQPPSNWYSSYGETFGHQLAHSSGFSSFQMAHMFPDCVGEVDVVSDAENIKKLLKIPYSTSPISMVVHRIENTLLLDDFDLHSHLLKQSASDWEWMRKVFVENFLQNMNRDNLLVKKNVQSNQHSLVSKFLHYSLPSEEQSKEHENEELPQQNKSLPAPKVWPCLPEPPVEKELPDPSSERHKFARNVIWTFEDIQMLLGTDMPIFGGTTHPCLSLRLRDMKKPINVLTGIDYWLDNLMCNVPEVVMCYHLEGIVQKYELIKTEELPDMENSKFSPRLIRDVAQNILSFLKSNATKAGHTYWLFKGKDEEVVKLYDLTSLCSDELVDTSQNPFTVPVAMLLYRVARNMKYSKVSSTNPATIRMLLKNCLTLLSKEGYPQIVTSCHYMLADLYIPFTMDPAKPNLDEKFQPEKDELDSYDGGPKSLCVGAPDSDGEEKFPLPPPLVETLNERCKAALVHVSEGLRCLQFFPLNKTEDKQNDKPREEPSYANPNEPIPMPFINKNQDESDSPSSLLCKKEEETMPTWQKAPAYDDSVTWKKHLQMLLYKKACLIYAALAEFSYNNQRYGNALKYIEAVLHCRTHTGLPYSGALASYLLGRAGDCCFKAVQEWNHVDTHNKDLTRKVQNLTELVDTIVPQYSKECDLIPKQFTSIKETMLTSCACYEHALATASSKASQINLWPRLGNIYNELGSMHMNEAGIECQKENSNLSNDQICDLFKKAQTFLEKGISAFEFVRDDANLALLHSNMGRLMRLLAHANISNEQVERGYYSKALDHYQTALAILENRKRNILIWDTVTWELSTALYNLAVISQEFPSYNNNSNSRTIKNYEQVERDVVELLLKALKYCDVDTPSPRQIIYQFRAAIIHHRLASLYHNSYRLGGGETSTHIENKKKLSIIHYERAARLLLQLENTTDLLRVQLERIALCEYQVEKTNNVQNKIKHLQNALNIAVQCIPTLELLEIEDDTKMYDDNKKDNKPESDKKKESKNTFKKENKKMNEDISERKHDSEDKSGRLGEHPTKVVNTKTNDQEELQTKESEVETEQTKTEHLVKFLEQRLQVVLKSLTKLCLKNTNQATKLSNLGNLYKDSYMKLLRKDNSIPLETHLKNVLLLLKGT